MKMRLTSYVAVLWLMAAFNMAKVMGTTKIVCYYGSWAVYRPGNGKFDVEDIDPNICTHLVYGFAGLDPSTNNIKALDPWNDLEDNGGKGAFKRFNALRKQNPNLRTLIAIGGWNEGSEKYSQMASSAETRQQFASSCVSFVSKYGFNGLDLDWEYPAARGGRPQDRDNYILLIKELRRQFDKYGLLLSAAVAAGKSTVDSAYNVPEMAKYLDYISVMAYDFHGSWESVTGHNAPMNQSPQDVGDGRYFNVNSSINYWLSLGAPASKLVLGVGTYGRSFTLGNPQNPGIYQPSKGPGAAGPYTREPGNLGYNEICENNQKKPWTVIRDDYAKAPYAYQGDQWVGYDDETSIDAKVQFAKSKGLSGVMVWSVETDDFRGICSGTKFPLIRTINKSLKA